MSLSRNIGHTECVSRAHESKSRRTALLVNWSKRTRPRTVAAPWGVARPPCVVQPVRQLQFSFAMSSRSFSGKHTDIPSRLQWSSSSAPRSDLAFHDSLTDNRSKDWTAVHRSFRLYVQDNLSVTDGLLHRRVEFSNLIYIRRNIYRWLYRICILSAVYCGLSVRIIIRWYRTDWYWSCGRSMDRVWR